MKLVTVIIPFYNVEKYLPVCIESVLKQSYKKLEIILIDDGSTDNSLLICKKFKGKDKRIKIYHTNNFGLSHARNVGLDHANGDYIVFVDSDDYIDENMINIMLTKSNDSDLVICNYKKVQSKDIGVTLEISQDKQVLKNQIWDINSFWKHYYFDNLRAFCCVAWNKLYKKKLFNKIRYPVGKIHEDEYVIGKIVNQCNSIKVINNSLYYYVQRVDSIMHKDYRGNFEVAEAYLNRCAVLQEQQQLDIIKENLLEIPSLMVSGFYESKNRAKIRGRFNLMRHKYSFFIKKYLKESFSLKLYLKQLLLLFPNIYYLYLKVRLNILRENHNMHR